MPLKPRRKFKTEGRVIWAKSMATKYPGGQRISIGFPVATVNENLEHPEKIAKEIAKAMNASTAFR